MDPPRFTTALFERNVVAAPSSIVRRSLWQRLGGFSTEIASEDYDLWWRALRAGAVFHYDPRLMVHLRQHGENASADALRVSRSNYALHTAAADLVDDPGLVRDVLANDLRAIGRSSLGAGLVSEARRAYRASLRQRRDARTWAVSVLLGLPGAAAALRRVNAARRPA